MSDFEIVASLSREMGVDPAKVRSHRRWRSLCTARRVIARMLREIGRSYPEIGRALGGRHHTTVMAMLGALPGKLPKARAA